MTYELPEPEKKSWFCAATCSLRCERDSCGFCHLVLPPDTCNFQLIVGKMWARMGAHAMLTTTVGPTPELCTSGSAIVDCAIGQTRRRGRSWRAASAIGD